MLKLFCVAVIGVVLSPGFASVAAAAPAFHFEVKEGQNLNEFLREGKTAAHLVLRSGHDPRILVAFPAGNSGVGLWFQPVDGSGAQWVVDSAPGARGQEDA